MKNKVSNNIINFTIYFLVKAILVSDVDMKYINFKIVSLSSFIDGIRKWENIKYKPIISLCGF